MDLNQLFNGIDSPLVAVCSSIVDAVIVTDSKGNFVYWNESARELLGSDPDPVPSTEWASHFKLYYVDTDKFLDLEDLPILKVLRGETYSDYLVMTKNQNYPEGAILSVNGKPIMDKGKIVGAFNVFSNVTAKVRMENQIKNERAFFMDVLDLLPNHVCIKDLEGRYIYANKTFLQGGGVRREDLIGRQIKNVLHPESAQRIEDNERLVIETMKPHDFDEFITWGENSKGYFQSTRFPYFDSTGNLVGIGAVFKDVTKDVEAKIEVEQERNRTAHMSKLAAIGVLAAEIAHEIKNPLTILKTNNDVIRYALAEENIDREFVLKRMAIQNDTIDRMNKVASSLSAMSKDASREAPASFTLVELISEMKELINFRTRKLNVEIEVEYNQTENQLIIGNRIQISEVLLNLLVNALDAVEKVRKPKIKVECELTGANLYIKVYDNGAGVPKDIVDKIFEPFFTTKDVSKGTGLGLSISKKIMEHHRGELSYEERNEMHWFVIKMPV